MDRYAAAETRDVTTEEIRADLCVVGGGLAGTCAAITGAREGLEVVLVQDRPVLGGNSSSEVRLWALGATAHMGNNNRWSREGGVMDEIFVENTYRNPEGNPVLYDTVVLEKAVSEPTLRLLLNTAVNEVRMRDGAGGREIDAVIAYNSQNETRYRIRADYFVDASGDGVVAYSAGVPFRFGAEDAREFDEPLAPDPEVYGERLGHSIFFYTKDVGEPVTFHAPSYALKEVPEHIPRYRSFSVNDNGCRFWWIEYGGRLDTVHDTEAIKWELWKVIFGVWDYIKNSGAHPEAENLTLEWVGAIPGKRESRRFEGYQILTQADVIEQRIHEDGASYGGWSIDHHPADGVYSTQPPSRHYHAKGVYQIPYSSMITPHVRNLFLAGRIISTSHVAFGTTRVMATCAHGAQAVAMAAALALKEGASPEQFRRGEGARRFQLNLLRRGQHIPHIRLDDPADLTANARITASSEFTLDLASLPSRETTPLDRPRALLAPLSPGRLPEITFRYDADADTTLRFRLLRSEKAANFTPELELAAVDVPLRAGTNHVARLDLDIRIAEAAYHFFAFPACEGVRLRTVDARVTGLIHVRHTETQSVEPELAADSFEFWPPERRPGGKLPAVTALVDGQPEAPFAAANVVEQIHRPEVAANAWVSAVEDPDPALTLEWEEPQSIRQCVLFFDTDADHAMETVLLGHPDRAMPFCVRSLDILDDQGRTVWTVRDNHVSRVVLTAESALHTRRLEIRVRDRWAEAPASLFGVHCYAEPVLPAMTRNANP